MDLLSYLQTGTKAKPPTKKRKGKKRKKIKWGTPHPKTGFKSFANKPTTQMDKLLTTITASLLQNPADKIRQQEVLKDYGYSIPIDEAREKIKKFSSAPEGYEDLEEEAARQLAKGKIEEKDINEFLMDRSQQQNPIRYDMLGKEYNEGLKATVNFVQDEEFEEGKRIITRIIKPQVNYKGIMIQTAQIEVTEA